MAEAIDEEIRRGIVSTSERANERTRREWSQELVEDVGSKSHLGEEQD